MVSPRRWVPQIAINFEPTGGSKAAITGDFVLLGSEGTPVLRPLRGQGIEVTALHSHMIEDPHLFFMHFWAHDDAQKLAQDFRAALDRANVKPRVLSIHEARGHW